MVQIDMRRVMAALVLLAGIVTVTVRFILDRTMIVV